MYFNNQQSLALESVVSEESAMTKEERYELIALIAQRVNESKDALDVEERQIWDSNDTELNFNEIVGHYSRYSSNGLSY